MASLNEWYRVRPAFGSTSASAGPAQPGKVVYIHPQGRYAVLEFPGEPGKPREGFHLDQLTERNRCPEPRAERRKRA